MAGAIDAPDAALVGWTTKFSFAGAPGFTTTVAVWVTPVPLIVADTVFDSATVEDSVPVATPLPLVVPAGWVRVFPEPVLASTTVAPEIRFPFASFAVTVIVLWLAPLEAVIGEVAATVDCAADTAPGFTTTVAVCVMATPFTVADTVFDSATVDVNVVVVTPLLLVAAGCENVLPVPETATTTVAPATGFPDPSFAVTVMVDPVPPAVIGDVAPTVV